MGGRLSQFVHAWRLHGASPWVVETLQAGFLLTFIDRPPLTRSPMESSRTYSLVKKLALQEQVRVLLDKNAIEIVRHHHSLGFYSHLFLVPKASGGWRPVIDLSFLNRFLEVPTFTMDTAESIRASLRPLEWVASLDLADAYFHIPIHPSSRKYLRFTMDGVVYQFRALPFGLSSAPWAFTKVIEELKIFASAKGFQLFQYLDDWLVVAASPRAVNSRIQQLLDLCLELGLLVNFTKSDLVPSQEFVFLGYQYDLQRFLVHPTPERFYKIQDLAERFLDQDGATAHDFSILLGVLSSTEKMVPMGRLFSREIQFCLKANWNANLHDKYLWIQLSPEARADLTWWLDPENVFTGSPVVRPPPDAQIFTDASNEGWGAHLNYNLASGTWSSSWKSLHINNLELEAVNKALQFWNNRLRNSHVLVATDNSTVVSYLNKQGGTHSISLSRATKQILISCWEAGITLWARHIPGRFNVLADSLSRKNQVIATEWTLSLSVVSRIFDLWGTPTVDMFATRFNNRLPIFWSPIPDPRAALVDALSADWSHLWGYAYPPTPIINRCLLKIRADKSDIILIAPLNRGATWFHLLCQLLIDLPRSLPLEQDLLCQPRSRVFHRDPGLLHLHAWRLSGIQSKTADFQRRLPLEQLNLRDSLLSPSTLQSGTSSRIGVVNGRVIHSKPLLN